MRYIKLLLVIILLLGGKLAYSQPCSSIAVWDASNRGGSGLYYTGENVRLSGGTSYYTPRYGSTACHLTDGWCRDESSVGWRQWQLVGVCSSCAAVVAGSIGSNQTICNNLN
jgi:hypothetical protein